MLVKNLFIEDLAYVWSLYSIIYGKKNVFTLFLISTEIQSDIKKHLKPHVPTPLNSCIYDPNSCFLLRFQTEISSINPK